MNSLDLGGQGDGPSLLQTHDIMVSYYYYYYFSVHFLLAQYLENGFKHCGVTQNLKRGMNLHFI